MNTFLALCRGETAERARLLALTASPEIVSEFAGSVFKTNLALSVIQVEAANRAENTLTVRLRQKKHNFGALVTPFEAELRFIEEMVTLEAREMDAADLAEEQTLNTAERIKLALRGDPKYLEELAETTGANLKTVKKTLSQLRKAKEVEPTGEKDGRSEQVRLSSQRPDPLLGDGTRDTKGDPLQELLDVGSE